MDSLRTKFGNVLREHRVKAGLTQEDLATDSELDRTYISLLELGKRQPSLETLFALAAALGTTASALVRDTEKLK